MTPKMQEALDRLATAGNLPKSEFHHSTVTALVKGGHVEEVPGDSAWITLKVEYRLPRRNPAIPSTPIDDDVIASGVHVDAVRDSIQEIMVTPKAWIMGCPSCRMPMVADPHHLAGCAFLAADSVADASAWVCRGRVKPTRVSRRRAQRKASAR